MVNGSNLKVGKYYRLVVALGPSSPFIGLVFRIISKNEMSANALAMNPGGYSYWHADGGWALYGDDLYEELSETEAMIYKVAD
jgi:hypothetical protein